MTRKIRKLNYIFFPLFFISILAKYGNNGSSSGKSHYTDILPFQPSFPERMGIFSLLDSHNEIVEGAILLYGAVSCGDENLSLYFMPNDNSRLYVSGGEDFFNSGAKNNLRRNIDARVLGIEDSDYKSVFSSSMHSSIFSLGFFVAYTPVCYENEIPKWSLKFCAPVTYLRHVINGKEQIFESSLLDDENESAKIAMSGLSSDHIRCNRWNFTNDIKGNQLQRGALFQSSYDFNICTISHIECDCSYNYQYDEKCSIETTIGGFIPLSLYDHAKQATYLFYPDFGDCEHFGLQLENDLQMIFAGDDEFSLKYLLNLSTSYWFPRTFLRTFDITGSGPWSRYLWGFINFSDPQKQKMEPMANFMTIPCSVSPNFAFVTTSEIQYERSPFLASIGYSFYTRQSEGITLDSSPPQVLLASDKYLTAPMMINPVRTIGLRMSGENTTITSSNKSVYYASLIRPIDIDKESVIHPALFSGTIYGKIGLFDNDNNMLTMNISYRASKNNNVIPYVSGWVTLKYNF